MAELLVPIDAKFHNDFCSSIEKSFIIPAFDNISAMHFAEIWQKNKEKMQAARKKKISRAEIKFDYMIIAYIPHYFV